MHLSKARKETFILLNPHMKDKENITCSLPVTLENFLKKEALRQKITIHGLVNNIINDFRCDFDDISFFYRGYNPKTLAERVTNLWKGHEESTFLTFQINKEVFNRLIVFKKTSDYNKSTVIKHIISKYLRYKKVL
jgi:hypothetical protein